ncbi:ribonuclease domain-containing protein [Fibrobacter sp. UBA4297]|uniref:ribonuclease domain-containing protein n=1 Tax=Fibrobacter sp. UBA4297 TaxID=1946536 RepID=UPI0025BC76A7|nr:ribonuclease domain-containing protein [Fibrobacter sp. UBA4297]
MKIKKILTLFFVTAISISTVACSVSAPADNDEYEENSSSSCSPVSSSSSTKKISSSSTAQSSSSVKISSSSFTEKSSSSKATSSSSQAKSSSSTKAISSSSVASSSSVEVKSIYEAVQESGKYTTRDSVAAYLCKFDKLPSNYVGKDEGQQLYESKTGKTFEKWNFNPWTTIGVMIGGDKFNNYASNASNYHATLPEGSYHEADIEYSTKNRGTKRLVYQSDCVIYYTADHYETFSKLEIQ